MPPDEEKMAYEWEQELLIKNSTPVKEYHTPSIKELLDAYVLMRSPIVGEREANMEFWEAYANRRHQIILSAVIELRKAAAEYLGDKPHYYAGLIDHLAESVLGVTSDTEI